MPPHLIERSSRAACRCCRSMARPKPARSRSIPGSAAIFRAPARPGCRACAARRHHRRCRQRGAAGHARRNRGARPQRVLRILGQRAGDREALHDGWYRTGDIGLRDTDGYFWVHDRKKNLIISGGENIYPAEVERVLLEHPDVSECGVIGRPDPRWDEVPVAYVIRRSGCRRRSGGSEGACADATRALQGAARHRLRR